MFAFVHDGLVHELFSEDLELPDVTLIDVSHVVGISVGWAQNADGSFSAVMPAPTTAVALLDYASARQNAILASVWSFNVAASGATVHTVTTRLDDRGQFAMMKVQGWLQLNAQRPDATMPYSNVDFSATSLTVAEADSLVEQAAAVDERSYAILNQIAAGVTAELPTITLYREIDEAFQALARQA